MRRHLGGKIELGFADIPGRIGSGRQPGCHRFACVHSSGREDHVGRPDRPDPFLERTRLPASEAVPRVVKGKRSRVASRDHHVRVQQERGPESDGNSLYRRQEWLGEGDEDVKEGQEGLGQTGVVVTDYTLPTLLEKARPAPVSTTARPEASLIGPRANLPGRGRKRP